MLDRRKRIRKLCCLLTILVLSAAGACTTATLQNTWTDDAYARITLNNILIIGVVEPQHIRKFLEDEFVRQLKARGIRAVSSYTLLSEEAKENEETMLSDEELKVKVEELGIDTVLLSRFIDISDISGYETYPTNFTSPRLADYYGFCCQNIVSAGYDVKFETKIFEAKDDKLIWSAGFKVTFERSPRFMTRSLIAAVLKDLGARRLVPFAP